MPYKKQQEYLEIDRSGLDKTRDHMIGGRGSAKTTGGLLLLCKSCLEWNQGLAHIWTEPTFGLCRDVFLREFRKMVPSEMYTLNKADMQIVWAEALGGATVDIRSRNVDNPYKEINKGPNYAAAIQDEIAYKFDATKYWDLDAAIRDSKAGALFHSCLTTPKMNDYYDLVHDDAGEHIQINATSYDNPHLPPSFAADLESKMGRKQAAQEVLGQWTPLSGLLWYDWSEEDWPAGNRHYHEHDYTRPFYLFFDLGAATSAFLIVQTVRPIDPKTGLELWQNDPVWVVTAEYTPKREGAADLLFARIKQDYGTPVQVVGGADVSTRDSASGRDTAFFIRRHFGGSVQIRAISYMDATKEQQYNQLTYGIGNPQGQRKFCVSKSFKKHDPESKRGILEMVKLDSFPDEKRPYSDIWGRLKEGRLEHIRDAAMYGAVFMFPPMYVAI